MPTLTLSDAHGCSSTARAADTAWLGTTRALTRRNSSTVRQHLTQATCHVKWVRLPFMALHRKETLVQYEEEGKETINDGRRKKEEERHCITQAFIYLIISQSTCLDKSDLMKLLIQEPNGRSGGISRQPCAGWNEELKLPFTTEHPLLLSTQSDFGNSLLSAIHQDQEVPALNPGGLTRDVDLAPIGSNLYCSCPSSDSCHCAPEQCA
ncbi:hypothetical protein MHYP_G00070080 [Metynnis hypsauchen]